MTRQRLVLLLACIAGLVLAAGLAWRGGAFAPSVPPAAVGGPFQLVDQNGRSVDETILKGKWSVIFFGFTYCPDVCPTTMQALATASDLLGPKARDLQILFVSVDPDRDSPAQIKAWIEAQRLPKSTLGLTGTPEQVAATAKVYRIFYEKRGEGADYQVDHSSAVYLMDRRGRFVRPLAFGMTPEQIAEQIRAAMRGD